jgi:hypothetical protein
VGDGPPGERGLGCGEQSEGGRDGEEQDHVRG